MSRAVAVGAGGIQVELAGEPDLLAIVRRRYPNFLTETGSPAVRLELLRDEALHYKSPFQVLTERRGAHLRLWTTALAAEADLAAGTGTARLAGPRGVSPATREAVLENLLRVLWARLAVDRDLVLVHGASAQDVRRGAFLFYGPSGAGKTTASTLSAGTGRVVLSDDIVLVGPEGEGGVVHATPFWGEAPILERKPRTCPLAGLAELVKAPAHARVPHTPVEAVTSLLGSVPFTETLSPAEAHKLLGLVTGLCERVPSFQLRFAKDAGFWDVL